MHDALLKLYIQTKNLLSADEGQDLVEYALVVALIALGATVAMNGLATTIGTTFTNIGTKLTGATS